MASQINKTMPLGHGQTDQGRMDRIMAMIEKEPVYAESPEVLGQYKQAAVPRTSRFFGRHFKKIAIAATLIFALGITPFGGTTFAGELINWANQVMIKNSSGGDLEGINQLLPIYGETEFKETALNNLDEALDALGPDAFDISMLPKGYVFSKGTKFEMQGGEAYFCHLCFESDAGVKGEDSGMFFLEYIQQRDAINEISGDVKYVVKGKGIEFSEVDFIDGKAMLMKRKQYYGIQPVPIKTIEDNLELTRMLSIAYSRKDHDSVWQEGLVFLEQWYTLITKP